MAWPRLEPERQAGSVAEQCLGPLPEFVGISPRGSDEWKEPPHNQENADRSRHGTGTNSGLSAFYALAVATIAETDPVSAAMPTWWTAYFDASLEGGQKRLLCMGMGAG